jgi:predicted ATPase
MESIRIKNLRSLRDTGTIKLKSINILVGMNSSGKSTFLRTFPLLRQSVEKKTMGPILWNGEFTDFGSFETSLCNCPEDENKKILPDNDFIGFDFEFNIPKNTYTPYRLRNNTQNKISIHTSIKIKKGHFTDSSYTSEYTLKINENTVVFALNEMGIIERISSPTLFWELEKNKVKFQRTVKDTILPVFINVNREFHPSFSERGQISEATFKQLVHFIKKTSQSTSENKVNSIALQLSKQIDSKIDRLEKIKSIKCTKKWNETVQDWTVNHSDFNFISGLLDWYFIINNSFVINEEITKTLKSIHYIAPLRASTERYYRYQELGVYEIDHKGGNLAMFIRNIYHTERDSLNSWTMDNFGFKIEDFDDNDSHLSIKLSKDSKRSFNISDMGFGYSQILPIIVQLWSISSGYETKLRNNELSQDEANSVIVAIEQPELHLHPKMQADVANVFHKSILLAKKNNIKLKLIIETHSQTLISKFGDIIAENPHFSTEDINIILFEQDEKSYSTKIDYANFNQDGILTSWPYGFFNY